MVQTGSSVTFNPRVKNRTEVLALNVRVCDTLPSGLTGRVGARLQRARQHAVPGHRHPEGLAAKSLSFTARVTASVSSLLTNRATATPPQRSNGPCEGEDHGRSPPAVTG